MVLQTRCPKILALNNYLGASVSLFMSRIKEANHDLRKLQAMCSLGTSFLSSLLLRVEHVLAHSYCPEMLSLELTIVWAGHQVGTGVLWLTSSPCEGPQSGFCCQRQQRLVQVQVHQRLKPTRKDIFNPEAQWAMVSHYNWYWYHSLALPLSTSVPTGPLGKIIFPKMIFLPLPKSFHKKAAVSRQINK